MPESKREPQKLKEGEKPTSTQNCGRGPNLGCCSQGHRWRLTSSTGSSPGLSKGVGTDRPSSLGPVEAWYAGVMRLTLEVGARPEPAE